ncbi:MAG TPA: hypothetical protein VGF28_01215 [Thermoanaerobaculia bacterium]|jgi:uncharacterized membrane protein YcjF (UPF0283 family)
MKNAVENIWVARAVLFLFGLSLLLSGLRELLFGDLHYSKYWGGDVFAPVAVLIGAFFLGVLVWKWKTLTTPEERPKLKGRAARLARKAEETKFPIDDYEKW